MWKLCVAANTEKSYTHHTQQQLNITANQNTTLKCLKLVAFCFPFRLYAFGFTHNNTLFG